jgi:PEP-CTERM motif-containing protein
MKSLVRTLILATCFAAAATTASAQTNPMDRGGQRDSFYYGALKSPRATPLPPGQNNSIGRPVGRYGPVTPVPEPSQWAMMLAGLALVGWIVRRNSKR